MNLGDPVHMRLLVDHSCIECYLGSGEVLSTRIYRWGCWSMPNMGQNTQLQCKTASRPSKAASPGQTPCMRLHRWLHTLSGLHGRH